MDYTQITAVVDWSGVLVGIGAISVLLAGVLVAYRGAQVLVDFVAGWWDAWDSYREYQRELLEDEAFEEARRERLKRFE